MKKIDLTAKWIWDENNTSPNSIVIFKKEFTAATSAEKAIAYIAADTKYWLWINGKNAVFEGGLFRESMPGAGYADEVDLAPFLKNGKNELICLCWYYGNEGRNNVDSGHAGWIFECKALGLYSDRGFSVLRHPAFYQTGEPYPSFLYGGHNIGFDANKEINTEKEAACFFQAATEYPPEYWGDLYLRPIPLHQCSEIHITQREPLLTKRYEVSFPAAVQFTPFFEINAKGGEVVHIFSDRWMVPGGPGDQNNQYKSHRTEYRCKPGSNRFDSIFYLYGEKMILQCDQEITFLQVGYRSTGYNTTVTGEFFCSDDIVNILVKKAANTLYVCMRDNFMDCPDRERGQWIGDVSVQAAQVPFLMDKNAMLLLKKCIYDFIHLRKGDILMGNVPGKNAAELPSQSLNAISKMGLIALYSKYSGDREIFNEVLEPAVRYLMLWQMNDNGLVVPRKCNWRWFDHLYNVDEDVLENAWYYSALTFAKEMSSSIENHTYDDFLQERTESLRINFNKTFLKNGIYQSKDFIDDRANALAVLSGLCEKENYETIKTVLLSVSNASIYMENYVLGALCQMGYIEEAYKRMVSRYYHLAKNNNSTLWEDFYILGTKNHAWSGAPAVIAFQYFLGIDTCDGFDTVTVNPCTLFSDMHGTFLKKNGKIHITVKNGKITVDNQSESKIKIGKEIPHKNQPGV